MKSLRERVQGILEQQKREEESRKQVKPKHHRKVEMTVCFATREWKEEKKSAIVAEYRGGKINSIIRETMIAEIEKIYENITYDMMTRLMIPASLWCISGSIWYNVETRKKLLAWGIQSQADMLQEIYPYYLAETQHYAEITTEMMYDEKVQYFARRLENLIVKIGKILEGKVELKAGETLENLKKKKEHYKRKVQQYRGKKSVAKTFSLSNIEFEAGEREKILFWKGFTKLNQERREKFYGKNGEKIPVKEIPSEFLQDRAIEKYAGYCEMEEEIESFSGILAEILKKDEEGIAGGIRRYIDNIATKRRAKEEFRVYLNEQQQQQIEKSVRMDDRFVDREERIFFSSDWRRLEEWKMIEIEEEEELVLV